MNTYETAGLKVNMECADKTAAQAEKYKVDASLADKENKTYPV
jgi:hypothetical protein